MQIAQGEKTKPKQTAARAATVVSLQHKNKFNHRGALCGYQDKVLLFCVEPRVPQLRPGQSGGEGCKQAAGGATSAAATPSLLHGNLLMMSWRDGLHMRRQAD